MTRILVFLALMPLVPPCRGQEPRPGPQVLRAGCSPGDDRLGTISSDDMVEVHGALAGGEETCYRVTLARAGQTITGYVLGGTLPAVTAFVKQQAAYRDASFEAQDQLERARREALSRAQAAPAPANASSANASSLDKLDPEMPVNFEEFGGRDIKGKPFSLSGLGGRVILVTFWSPRSAASKRQLLTVLPLYSQYKRAGLQAVGISMDPNPSHIAQALDDITLDWPQIPDRSGMAQRYGASAATGTTLVLDASHHIVAAGLTGPALERKVRELLSAR